MAKTNKNKQKPKNKKVNEKVVAVSGGFDPLHIGHIRLFQEAKKLGDKLIVILNNDNWLKSKKGYFFMPEKERKEIIESIGCVDEVVITKHKLNSKDRSVCKELKKIRPRIFANGGDRYKDNIPEVEACNKIGCEMVFNIGFGGKIQSSSWLLNDFKSLAKLESKINLLKEKNIIIFDLDGTLVESKTKLDKEMSFLLCNLLKKKIIAIIGGGDYSQFKNQFIDNFNCSKKLFRNLYILPTSGGKMYRYNKDKWQIVYKNDLTKEEKEKIFRAFEKVFSEINYVKPDKIYGKLIEDRKSQITFSALGQKAPLEEKESWNKKNNKTRTKLRNVLVKYLPDFEVRMGGLTSIDVTKKNIDKAYGINKIGELLNISIDKMIYIGDALYKNGNDSAVFKTRINTIQVNGVEETKYLIRRVITSSYDILQ